MKSEDIAKLAGVSRSTVSRVINNYSNVPEATRIKVMKVIDEYHYRPNTFARTLAGIKSNTIGLFFVVTGETSEESKIAGNDYFSSYLNYLVDVANGMNYYVLVNTISSEEDYEKVNSAFLEKRIDAGVIIGTQADTLDKLQVSRFNAPIILLDHNETDDEDVYVINSKDRDGIEKAVLYLKEKGHYNIGFIKGDEKTKSSRDRYEGYINAMAKHGLMALGTNVIDGEFSRQKARDGVLNAIECKQLPTAYISSNDYMAIEIMSVLQDKGYRIPKDMSIIGYDNVPMSEQTIPSLTTLAPDFYNMAKGAIELVNQVLKSDEYIDNTENEEAKIRHSIEYEVELIIRESV